MAQADTFHFVLKDMDHHEGLERREFDLAVGKSFPIGRSSRNASKPELMPAAHNAYINSPVISREHALLSVNADDGHPQVYLKDIGSMHGTQVNGTRLPMHKLTRLMSGDTVQFGADVNRNEEFYVARKYVIEFHLNDAPPSFSRGFTVPDSDGEEEVPAPKPQGSQTYPLCIDDSDDSDDSDIESVTPPDEQSVVHDVTVNEDLAIEIVEDVSPTNFDEYPEAAMRSTLDKAPTPEHQASSPASSSVQYDLATCTHDFDSVESFMGESDIELDSEMDIAPAFSDYTDSDDDASVNEETVVAMSSLKDVRATGDVPPSSVPFLPVAQSFNPNYELPPFASFRGPLPTGSGVSEDYLAPPLPPRPTASTAHLFDREFEPENAAEMLRQTDSLGDRPPWIYDGLAGGAAYEQNYPTIQASIYHPDLNQLPVTYAGPSGVQTPPGFRSDVKSPTPPVPCRRTMMSIPDMVEEQPLTPASVAGVKRKADVLEDSEPPMVAMENPLTEVYQEPLGLAEAAPHTDTRVEDQASERIDTTRNDALIAQRPKKQPRSILKALKSTATIIGYGAVGAAVTFAGLANLPDTFFT